MTQEPLFEPTGPEVAPLAMLHAKKADRLRNTSDAARARGWDAVAESYAIASMEHFRLSNELAMLADLERMAGVHP